MYQDYFGLNRKPFGIVPDTRFLFLSDSHKEAIAHLVYALNEKNGFVQLTGEVGVGKTMACRYILANIPEDIDVALILNPRIDEIGLLRTLCQELNLPFDNQQLTNELTQLINNKLLETHADGRHTILIIDEAQNLPKRTMEQIRLLTNLETDTQKLLRIILIGQPELAQLLSAHDMRQVAQRITSRYHLGTLNETETDEYIRHRLSTAGCERRLFSKSASRSVYKLTYGTPRLINLLCDRALIGAYSLGVNEVSAKIVKIAAKEALPLIEMGKESRLPRLLPALAIFLALAALAIGTQKHWRDWLNEEWQSFSSVLPNPAPEFSKPAQAAATPERKDNQLQPLNLNEEVNAQKKTQSVTDKGDFDTLLRQAEVDFRLGIPSQPKQ